ncbi:hypothetical protein K439DRAFT_1297243, partial [Ramaria rubella]
QTFGITIGLTVMQNELEQCLPPFIRRLMQQEVAALTAVIWHVLTGIMGTGLVSCLITKDIPMSDELDKVFVL